MSMFVDYGTDVRELLQQAEAAADPTELLTEARDLIAQMKLEVRTMGGGEKASALSTVQELEGKLQEAESKALMGGGAAQMAPGTHERMRTDAAVQRLERSSAVGAWVGVLFVSAYIHTYICVYADFIIPPLHSLTHSLTSPHSLTDITSPRPTALQALERAKAVVAETEEIGVDITGTLAENREKIESAHDKARTANQDISKAEKITTRMGKWWARW